MASKEWLVAYYSPSKEPGDRFKTKAEAAKLRDSTTSFFSSNRKIQSRLTMFDLEKFQKSQARNMVIKSAKMRKYKIPQNFDEDDETD